MGLVGEAGELANKVKKVLRGDKLLADQRELILFELGDVMWYVAQLAVCLDCPLELVGWTNIEKLRLRQEHDKLKGEGDNR